MNVPWPSSTFAAPMVQAPMSVPVAPQMQTGTAFAQHLTQFAQEPCESTQDLNFLREDLAGELQAINQYWTHIEKASDPRVKALLCHIMNDEKEHYAEITALIRQLDPSQSAKFQKFGGGASGP